MKRAYSVNDVLSYKPESLDFGGRWSASFGCPEKTSSWLIWGESGNGKTAFALMLAKYMTNFGKVIYNTTEQGLSGTIQKLYIELGMSEVRSRIMLLDREPMNELSQRLNSRRSADFIFIDSIQYTGMNYNQYVKFRSDFRNKSFIFISHADGKAPQGRTAKSVRYDVDVKLRAEGYMIPKPMSRFGGGDPFLIWDKGASDYWSKDFYNTKI